MLSFASLSAEEEQTIAQFLSAVRVLKIGDEVERQAISLRRQKALKLSDAIIAATAIANRLTLRTLDRQLASQVET